MRTILAFCLAISVILPIPAVLGGKQKTAEFKDGLLKDTLFGYSLRVPKNWRVKVFDEPSVLRAMLLKKNYEVNREVKDLGGDFTIPEVRLFSRPDTITATTFLDELKRSVLSHKSEDKIINQLELLLSGEFVTAQEVELAGNKCLQGIFRRNYTRELQTDPFDPKYRQYGGLIARNEYDVHEIYIFSKDGNLFVMQAFAEREFYPNNKDEFSTMLSSLNFVSGNSK